MPRLRCRGSTCGSLLFLSRKYRLLKVESDVIALLDSGQQKDRSDPLRAWGRRSSSLRWGAYGFTCHQPLTSRETFARCFALLWQCTALYSIEQCSSTWSTRKDLTGYEEYLYCPLGYYALWRCKNRRFGGTYRLHHEGDKNRRARNNVSSN
jgi:hypothetical protein